MKNQELLKAQVSGFGVQEILGPGGGRILAVVFPNPEPAPHLNPAPSQLEKPNYRKPRRLSTRVCGRIDGNENAIRIDGCKEAKFKAR